MLHHRLRSTHNSNSIISVYFANESMCHLHIWKSHNSSNWNWTGTNLSDAIMIVLFGRRRAKVYVSLPFSVIHWHSLAFDGNFWANHIYTTLNRYRHQPSHSYGNQICVCRWSGYLSDCAVRRIGIITLNCCGEWKYLNYVSRFRFRRQWARIVRWPMYECVFWGLVAMTTATKRTNDDNSIIAIESILLLVFSSSLFIFGQKEKQ